LSSALLSIVWLLAAAPVATNGAQGGEVEVQLLNGKWHPLSFGEELAAGMRVRTGKLGFARLDFAGGGGIRIFESSELLLHPEGEVSIEKGVGRAFLATRLAIVNADGSRPLLVARGDTPVQVRLTRTDKGLEIAALQGSVSLQASGEERVLEAGQFSEVVGGEAGEPRPLIAAPTVTAPVVDSRFHCPGLIARIGWSPLPGASGYRLQLAKDPGFQQLLTSDELAGTHQLFVPREPGRYVFRVAAKDRAGRWSEPTEPQAIHCEPTPPEDFLLSPPAGASVRFLQKPPPVSFSWVAAPGAPTYRFVLAKTEQLEATALIKKTSTEPKLDLDALPEGDYFWGVYLEDALPYPLFVAPRAFSFRKEGKQKVTAPKSIKDWGK
jgi:hypothetical protein